MSELTTIAAQIRAARNITTITSWHLDRWADALDEAAKEQQAELYEAHCIATRDNDSLLAQAAKIDRLRESLVGLRYQCEHCGRVGCEQCDGLGFLGVKEQQPQNAVHHCSNCGRRSEFVSRCDPCLTKKLAGMERLIAEQAAEIERLRALLSRAVKDYQGDEWVPDAEAALAGGDA